MAAARAGPGRWVDGIYACPRGGVQVVWWSKEYLSGDRALPRHRLRPPGGAGSGPARWWHPDPAMQRDKAGARHRTQEIGLGIGFGRRRRDLDRGEGERQAAAGEGERGIGLLLGFGLGRYDLRGE